MMKKKKHEDLPEEDFAVTEEEPEIGLSVHYIMAVREALEDDDKQTAFMLLDAISSADSADLLQKIKPDERLKIIKWFGDKFTPEMFLYLSENTIRELFEEMPAKAVARIAAELDTDDAISLLEPLDDKKRLEIMNKLTGTVRTQLEEGFAFPEDSAGRLMNRDIAVVPEFWTVGKTLDYARMAEDNLPEEFLDIFIVDPQHRVVGEVPLDALIRSRRSVKVRDIAKTEIFKIPVFMDKEEVAHLFRRDDILSAPVVDDSDRLIGVITLDDIVDVIDEEAEEDVLKLGGVGETDISSKLLPTVYSRFSWLAVNLLTAIAASACISMFDKALEKVVALAILMPIVTGMGGNAGTQSMTVAVRGIATKELSRANATRVLVKECFVGNINGILFALIMGAVTWWWFNSSILGLVIGLAMVANLTVACFAGIIIPLVLHKMKIDPALASTVFLTTVTDIVGFVVFLGLGTVFLL